MALDQGLGELRVEWHRRYQKTECLICAAVADLQVHHVDGDHSNNSPDNLATLCQRCHSAVHAHFGAATIDELAGLALRARRRFPDHFLGRGTVEDIATSVVNEDGSEDDSPDIAPDLTLFVGGGKSRRQNQSRVTWTVVRSAPSTVSIVVAQGQSDLAVPSNLLQYHALRAGLLYALKEIPQLSAGAPVRLHTSSELVVKQVAGDWKCRDEHLRRQLEAVRDLLEILETRGHPVEVSHRSKKELDRRIKEWHPERFDT